MIQQALTTGALSIALALSPTAHAQFVIGAPIVVPHDGTLVTIEFVSADAFYTGELLFLGAGSPPNGAQPAGDSASAGTGQPLFVNQTGVNGELVALEGVYNAGDVLHFAYRVFEPASAADLLHSDEPDTAGQFAWDQEAGLLYVEDLRPSDQYYDGDFNDIILHVTFTGVPAPATGLTLLVGAAMGSVRRRRPA